MSAKRQKIRLQATELCPAVPLWKTRVKLFYNLTIIHQIL
jgi:hypothetical protein